MTEPKYEGDPKIHPERLRVDGNPIRGWVVEHVTAAGDVLRRWLEPFKPGRVPDGCVARPLTYADGGKLPTGPQSRPGVNPPAPAVRPPVPPSPPQVTPAPPSGVRLVTQPDGTVVKVLPAPLQELKRTCNMNRNSGQTSVPINYVLECLEKYSQS